MSFEKPPVPESEQGLHEQKRIELFFEHYLARHPELDDDQRGRVKTFMLNHSSKAWGQYDDVEVYPSTIAIEHGHLVINFDVMGNDVQERIPLSE